MIGEDDESQTGATGGRGNVVGRARSVGTRGVNVNDAGNAAVGRILVESEAARRNGEDDEGGDDGRQDRHRREPFLQRPASDRSAAALSVRSHVNSGSVRPKWPKAAVFW